MEYSNSEHGHSEHRNPENFSAKFDRLTLANQRYIIAIQQALLLVQMQEHTEKQNLSQQRS